MYHYIAALKENLDDRREEYIRWVKCNTPEDAITLFNREHGRDSNYILKKIVYCPDNVNKNALTDHLSFVSQRGSGYLRYK